MKINICLINARIYIFFNFLKKIEIFKVCCLYYVNCFRTRNKMIKALKLNGGWMSSFSVFQGKTYDLSKPLKTSHMEINWEELKGKKINNKNVILSKYGDIHPFANGPVFTCENLFLNHCDKNFLCYWFNKNTFPNVNTVYICSHPCEPYVLTDKFNKIYLHTHYKKYKERWYPHLDNVKIISDYRYQLMIGLYYNENIILDTHSINQ